MSRYLTWGILAVAGAVAFVVALGFGWGRGSQIGSAPLPVALSAGLVIVSVLGMLAPSVEEVAGPDWRPFAAVVAAVLIFIAGIDRIGMIPTTMLSMAAAYAGQSERRLVGFVVYAAGFAAGAWVLFTIGLGLPVPAFGG